LKEVNKKYIALQSAIIKQGDVPCSQYPELFFPEDLPAEAVSEAEKLAVHLCKKCPVLKLCLDYAMTAREPYGIWGGTTPADR
jgi:WhiB family redox-sensing transcriptional regulator